MVAVRAVRGAIQVGGNERADVVDGVTELLTEVLRVNAIDPADIISILFTSTPDLTAEFPAYAARTLGLTEVPLMCACEIAVPGALPLTLRLLAHIETPMPRSELQHIYLRGAAVLRPDLPRPDLPAKYAQSAANLKRGSGP